MLLRGYSLVMKSVKTLLLATLLIFSANSVSAQYYVEDYDPDYVPYNLQQAIDSMDFIECKEEVKLFDTTYNEYLDIYGTPISVGDTLDVQYGALKEITEERIRDCITDYREYQQQEAIDDCDFSVIDTLTESQIDDLSNSDDDYLEKVEECEVERALNTCDMDFIENMSSGQKVTHHKAIDLCEPEPVETPEPVIQDEPKEIEPEVASIPEVVDVVPEPVVTPPVVQAPEVTPTRQAPVVVEDDNEETKEDGSTQEDENGDSNTIELTQDELDELVQQRVEQQLATATEEEVNPEPENKQPNIFVRVWNFFTSWF